MFKMSRLLLYVNYTSVELIKNPSDVLCAKALPSSHHVIWLCHPPPPHLGEGMPHILHQREMEELFSTLREMLFMFPNRQVRSSHKLKCRTHIVVLLLRLLCGQHVRDLLPCPHWRNLHISQHSRFFAFTSLHSSSLNFSVCFLG